MLILKKWNTRDLYQSDQKGWPLQFKRAFAHYWTDHGREKLLPFSRIAFWNSVCGVWDQDKRISHPLGYLNIHSFNCSHLRLCIFNLKVWNIHEALLYNVDNSPSCASKMGDKEIPPLAPECKRKKDKSLLYLFFSTVDFRPLSLCW